MIYKYIKRLIKKPRLCIKERNLSKRYKLLEKLDSKRSELKYLINFRKRNQKRFYD